MTDIRRHKSLRTQTGFYDRREQVLKLFERISTEHGDVRAISLQELTAYALNVFSGGFEDRTAKQLFDELGLTKESFTHPNELKQVFEVMDINHDGWITAEEFLAAAYVNCERVRKEEEKREKQRKVHTIVLGTLAALAFGIGATMALKKK